MAAGQSVRVPPLGAPPPAPHQAQPRRHPSPATRRCSARPRALSRRRRHRHRQARRASRSRAAPAPSAISTRCSTRCASTPRSGRASSIASTRTPAACSCSRASAAAAAALAAAFRGKDVRKVYWALTVGVPKPRQGTIDLPLAKLMRPRRRARRRRTTRTASAPSPSYRTVAHAGEQARLARAGAGDRAHASASRPCRRDRHADPGRRQIWRRCGASRRACRNARRLHLHARAIALPHPRRGKLDRRRRAAADAYARDLGVLRLCRMRTSPIPSPISRADD